MILASLMCVACLAILGFTEDHIAHEGMHRNLSDQNTDSRLMLLPSTYRTVAEFWKIRNWRLRAMIFIIQLNHSVQKMAEGRSPFTT